MLECKKGVLTFLLSVLTSDWLKQQKLTKLHKAVHIFILIPENIPMWGKHRCSITKEIAIYLTWIIT